MNDEVRGLQLVRGVPDPGSKSLDMEGNRSWSRKEV